MPVYTNDLFISKNIRVEDPLDDTKSVYIYYDRPSDSLGISHINPDIDNVPSFIDFNFDLSNKNTFYADQTITSVNIYFDGNIGSLSNITSQNGFILIIIVNKLQII